MQVWGRYGQKSEKKFSKNFDGQFLGIEGLRKEGAGVIGVFQTLNFHLKWPLEPELTVEGAKKFPQKTSQN